QLTLRPRPAQNDRKRQPFTRRTRPAVAAPTAPSALLVGDHHHAVWRTLFDQDQCIVVGAIGDSMIDNAAHQTQTLLSTQLDTALVVEVEADNQSGAPAQQ